MLTSAAESDISCCGRKLLSLEAQKADDEHRLTIEAAEDEYYVSGMHQMTKEHYIAFAALVKNDTVFLKRTFPQWDLQLYFPRKGHGMLYFYCTRDGLFCEKV